MRIGVPYARVVFIDDDDRKPAEECPDCGVTFPMRYDPDADMGCGALVSDYAQHSLDKHPEDPDA